MSTVSATSTSNPSLFEILSNGDITFVGAGSTTKMIIIGAEEFALHNRLMVTAIGPNAEFVSTLAGGTIYAPVDTPDSSTIQEFECKIFLDTDAGGDTNCALFKASHGGVPIQLSFLTTGLHLPTIQTLTDSTLSEVVDRDLNRYYVGYTTTEACADLCHLLSMKITYTVPSGFAIGGNWSA